MGQNQCYHFGVGAPPSLVYFSLDWDVHWGYELFDPWPGVFLTQKDSRRSQWHSGGVEMGKKTRSLGAEIKQVSFKANQKGVPAGKDEPPTLVSHTQTTGGGGLSKGAL